MLIKAIRIYHREGLTGVKRRVLALQNNVEFINRGMGFLLCFANHILKAIDWYDTSSLPRHSIVLWFKGFTKAYKNFLTGSIRFHIDNAPNLVEIVNDDFTISGWAVNLEASSPVPVRIIIGNNIYPMKLCERPDVLRVFQSIHDRCTKLGFASRILPPKLGFHVARTQIATTKEMWITVHRTFIWHRVKSLSAYRLWTAKQKKLLDQETPEIKAHIEAMVHRPVFTVIISPSDAPQLIQKTLDSLQHQIYPYFEQYIIKEGNSFIEGSGIDVKGEFVVLIKSGQLLAPNALYEFANEINKYPDADLIYGDEDSITHKKVRHSPFHKPEWSPDYLETFNYIGSHVCIRTKLAFTHSTTHTYDLVLRITEKTRNIYHIPKILCHTLKEIWEGNKIPSHTNIDIEALQGRLSRTGRKGTVTEHTLYKGCYDIRLHLSYLPLVSIIIPTAGKTIRVGERQIDLIQNLIHHIRSLSTYKNIEIIVVDNGDLTSQQIKTITKAGCKRVTYTDPVFNVSKKLNLGAHIAKGELFLLMNDDIEIISTSWIERMVEHFEKPHVGVVGCKLLYPDLSTQHVGVVHTCGNPEHVRRLFPSQEDGYFFSTCGTRNYTAVTGACTMTRAITYREVGGYSEELAVIYNDIDYCLKVRSKNLEVVYAPHAKLIHMESQSRGPSLNIRDALWYHNRWGAETVLDKFYNERFLSIAPPTFVPHINPPLL